MNGPNIKRKRRPKREVQSGFKMSYRYKYYRKEDIVEEDEEEFDDSSKTVFLKKSKRVITTLHLK